MSQGVITADIVASSKLSSQHKEWLYTSIEAYLETLSEKFHLEREWYRGDSFQIKVSAARLTLRVALMIRTKIRSLLYTGAKDEDNYSVDVRMALGVGSIDFERSTVSSSDGEAYRLSGRGLDRMKPGKQLFVISTKDGYEDELHMEALLLDALLTKTTALQCEVINLKLHGLTEMEIAGQLNIRQSAVNQRSGAGNWHVIHEMTLYFEQLYSYGYNLL